MATENLPAMFTSGSGLPAHLADLNEQTNIVGRETIPQLSYRGKVWRVVMDGEETICTKPDGEPMQIVPLVILEYNKKRSRAYFPGGYEEGKTSRPTCSSSDGVVPDANVAEPQASTCASCPQAVKGSKITDAGKETTACGQFKNAVVVAPTLPSGWKPLLLKMAQTSIWDKDAAEYEAKGFYAFDNYMDMLKRRGVNHTASVVTKVKFDPRVAYPKMFFGPADWLPGDVVDTVKELLADKEALAKLLNIDLATETLGVEAKPATPKAVAAPKPPPKAPEPPPAAAADEDEESVSLTPAAPKAPPKAAAAPKPPAAPKAPPKAAAAPKPPATEPVATASPEQAGKLGKLLSDWDADE